MQYLHEGFFGWQLVEGEEAPANKKEALADAKAALSGRFPRLRFCSGDLPKECTTLQISDSDGSLVGEYQLSDWEMLALLS